MSRSGRGRRERTFGASKFVETIPSPSDKPSSMSNCIGTSCGDRPLVRPDSIGGFRGRVRGAFQAREAAALQLKTADGDTVSISFEAVRRTQLGAGSVSAKSSIDVAVAVNGPLDDNEVAQISELLAGLVTAGRGGKPELPAAGEFSQIAAYRFDYDAQESRSGLLY